MIRPTLFLFVVVTAAVAIVLPGYGFGSFKKKDEIKCNFYEGESLKSLEDAAEKAKSGVREGKCAGKSGCAKIQAAQVAFKGVYFLVVGDCCSEFEEPPLPGSCKNHVTNDTMPVVSRVCCCDEPSCNGP